MVHSGSTSPMKTTSSASPHLTVPATAPPLMLSHGGTAVQELNHIPTQLLTTDLTPNSGFTQPSTLTPADSKSTVVTQEKTSSKALVSTPAPAPISGRTSGRKRTPKACKCCGPNSTGHNVKTSASGRGRGRGRGTVRNMGHIPKSNFQVSSINHLNFAEEKLEEEDVEDTCGEVQRPVAVDNAPSQTTETPVSFHELPVKRFAESEQQQVKKKKKTDQDSEIGAAQQKDDGDCLNTEKKLLGTADQGGFVVGSQEIEGREIEIKGAKGGAITSKSNALGQSLPGENQNTQNSQHKCRGDTNTINSSFRNGESVNLCNTEEGVQEDYIIVIDSGSLSTSWPITPGTLQVLDSEAEVFHSPERVDLFLAPTLSNGDISSKINSSTPMVEKPHLSMVLSSALSPITVTQKEHPWAILDHKLYAQPGTWDDFDEETSGRKSQQETGMDGTMPKEEILEHLTHMVHEFLEQFYIKYGSFIPLTETDVLEHLKTKCSPDLIDSGLDIKGEIKRYRAGLASAPFTSFMVTYNKHTLSLEDLGTLEEQNWLNDQIINMYGELIMEATEHKVHFFNSFFHKQLVAKGYEGVKRWTKKVDLFSKWLLLIPIHLEIHWSLVTVTMATKTISYYDSQGIVFRHTTDNIMKYLQSEASEKKLTAFQKGWTTAIIKGIPQQKNDSDCGVFILEYCRRLSVKKPLLFSQEDMPFIRKRIYKELCDCQLND